MDHNNQHGQMSFGTDLPKDSKQKLISYLNGLKFHPEVLQHATIAKSFGFPSYKEIFRADAIRRVLEATSKEPTTMAHIEKLTNVKQKYQCSLKPKLVKTGRWAVAYWGNCPVTGNRAQFLTSDVELIKSLKK